MESWLAGLPPGGEANWVTGSHDIGRVSSRVGAHLVDHLNMLHLLLPGVAVTYQGEELGMSDTALTWEETRDPAGCACGPAAYQQCSRDPERTPLQWTNASQAGFTSGSHPWLPVNPDYTEVNVAAEEEAGHASHLGVYRWSDGR